MQTKKLAVASAAMLALTSCSSDFSDSVNTKPSFLGAITVKSYDGASDDLLTAGLGKTGLAGAQPAYADPNNPTAAELRRNAIWANYRAVLDIAANSGYGTMYGPNVNAAGVVTPSEGKIAGTEYMAYTDDGSGKQNVTLLVQVPANFDPVNPCIVTGTSSGSRGIYGAIGSSGEWGLKNNCAVAYADKGSGNGMYTFDDDSVNLQNGVRATRTAAGKDAHFAPILTDAERAAFLRDYPNRVAFKHAHSQQNPEKDWGRITLQAIEFAFYVLNEKYGALSDDGKSHQIRLKPENTATIASSISNGGGSALLAAEQDSKGLIDAVAVTEPQIQPKSGSYTIRQGGAAVPAQGKPLFDYTTYAALYQHCIAGSAARCSALVKKGLLNGADLASQQADAMARLKAYGWQADTDVIQGAHALTNILVATTYLNAYGRFSVIDRVCGISFSSVDAGGALIPFTAAQRAASFAGQNGIIGTPVYENSVGGAKSYAFGTSPSTGEADLSLDAFLCMRSLALGVDAISGAALSPEMAALSTKVRNGIGEVQASGNLKGKPAIIVSGRSDALIPVNHAARAYVGLNAAAEGSGSKLRYVEVTNANHFDSFSSVYPTRIVPLHVYLGRALDAVFANIKNSSSALPPSQLIRTVTRADATVPITAGNLPAFSSAPGANAITTTGTRIDIPD
ncbi:D-(-)-3-hydroxybutyrate oligomer hydrolase [Massilia sp. MB5]|uniref:D-(-)-3-hydroxybutyrate oligomer hydrolase n=1 Tax=Massilia sp. MB5 TaxID=2919578 RepID=UPI001F0D244E|nr:D-(-)-3-hydroxybutyrate oligomer hydrolase [Massilia sp. MB5]UMR31860.1 D-(-)-3-hydroxybutyrate oligomer hydrolase [Massilia sp. MB5]